MAEANDPLSILIIEDNEMSLSIAETILAGGGEHHNIASAKTASEGIARFKELTPDITFLDITLPDGSGLDVLKEVKKEKSDAYVVVVTASRVKEDMWQAYDKGAQGYVMKPFSSQRMRECIEKYREHKSKRNV